MDVSKRAAFWDMAAVGSNAFFDEPANFDDPIRFDKLVSV